MTLVVRNPATGETLAQLPASSQKDVEAAVTRARAAQPRWAALDLEERARIVRAFQAAIVEHRVELARLVTSETGKPLTEALAADVIPAADAASWVATHGPRLLKPERVRLANPLLLGRVSRFVREPLGVVGIIGPWNYPLAIPAGQVAYALMAGNAVLLKPSEHTPLSALRLRALWTEAGLPEDLLIVLPGEGETTGDALVRADVDYVVFTGSVPVGRAVGAHLRERGIPHCLELGGSDPAIVLEDAVMPQAVRGIVWARFTNAGQTCAAPKRLLVHRALHDAFVAQLVERAQALRSGDPLREEVDIGPLITPEAVAHMDALVQDARERGARVLCGGHARADLGPNYYAPTVLVDVPREARIWREESFGPVLPVAAFESDEQAVELANDTTFGLSASVWTADVARGERLAMRIEAGTVVLNDAIYTFAANETPWGGTKDSGYGRTHGRWGFEEVTRLRHVNIVPARSALGSPWWFPYDRRARAAFDKGIRVLYGTAGDKVRLGAGVVGRLLRRR